MKTTVLSILLLAVSFNTGCVGEKAPEPEGVFTMRDAAYEAEEAPAPAEPDVQSVTLARKLIKTVNLELEARDTEAVAQQLQNLASELNGFVSSISLQRYQEVPHFDLTLRVPTDRLDEALGKIKEMSVRVEAEHVNTQDVTERFIDLEARLRTLGATETELQALLTESRQRAYKVGDIMEIYEQLTEIRSNIEQIQGQLNALENLASLSTIQISLRPTVSAKPVVPEAWRPADTIRNAARTLVEFLQGLVDFLLNVVIVIVPGIIIIGLPLWGLVHLWKRYRKAKMRRGE